MYVLNNNNLYNVDADTWMIKEGAP